MSLKKISYIKLIFILLIVCSCSSKKDYSKVQDIFYYYQNQNSKKPIKIFRRDEIANFDYEIVEIKSHQWFVGVQFHPEYSSTVLKPNPLFSSFIDACINNKI